MAFFQKPEPVQSKCDCLSDQDRKDLDAARRKREIAEEEKSALDRIEEFRRSAAEEHKRQSEGFVFRCSRFGQFLTLNVRRNGNPIEVYGQPCPREFATAINLNLVTQVRLVEGNVPDDNGDLRYTKGRGEERPRAYFLGCEAPVWRSLIKIVDDDEDDFDDDDDDGWMLQYRTKGFPRAAKDDQIIFEGGKLVLFAPAGLGSRIYREILTAKEA